MQRIYSVDVMNDGRSPAYWVPCILWERTGRTLTAEIEQSSPGPDVGPITKQPSGERPRET